MDEIKIAYKTFGELEVNERLDAIEHFMDEVMELIKLGHNIFGAYPVDKDGKIVNHPDNAIRERLDSFCASSGSYADVAVMKNTLEADFVLAAAVKKEALRLAAEAIYLLPGTPEIVKGIVDET